MAKCPSCNGGGIQTLWQLWAEEIASRDSRLSTNVRPPRSSIIGVTNSIQGDAQVKFRKR
jgi:hypothetical protein